MKEFKFWMTVNKQLKEFKFMANTWTEARAMMSEEYRKLFPSAR